MPKLLAASSLCLNGLAEWPAEHNHHGEGDTPLSSATSDGLDWISSRRICGFHRLKLACAGNPLWDEPKACAARYARPVYIYIYIANVILLQMPQPSGYYAPHIVYEADEFPRMCERFELYFQQPVFATNRTKHESTFLCSLHI